MTRDALLDAVLGPLLDPDDDQDARRAAAAAVERLATFLDARLARKLLNVETTPEDMRGQFPTPEQLDQAADAGTARAGAVLELHGPTAVEMVLRYLGSTGRAACPLSLAVTAALTVVAWLDDNSRMTTGDEKRFRGGPWVMRSSGAASILASYRRPYVGSGS